jgi:hypothetical protein
LKKKEKKKGGGVWMPHCSVLSMFKAKFEVLFVNGAIGYADMELSPTKSYCTTSQIQFLCQYYFNIFLGKNIIKIKLSLKQVQTI